MALLINANPLNACNRISSLHLLPPISHLYFTSRLCFSPKPLKIRSLSLKCNLSKPHTVTKSSSASTADSQESTNSNRILNAILHGTESLKKPAVVAILFGVLLMFDPVLALAATGGRMGGRSFSSSSSSTPSYSSSSSSRSYSSSSSSRSYTSSRPSYSSSSSSSSYSSTRPSYSSSSSSRWWSPRYSSSKKSPSPSHSDADGGDVSVRPADENVSDLEVKSPIHSDADGGEISVRPAAENVSDLEVKCPSYSYADGTGGAYVRPRSAAEDVWLFTALVVFTIVLVLAICLVIDNTRGPEGSVIKLQVGLSGTARSLQRDLDRIAEVADTSTRAGLHYVLTETVSALLRHPDYYISTYSSVDVNKSMDVGEKRFDQLSVEERGKFDEETLVNVDNIKRQSSYDQGASGIDNENEYMVVTILVAAQGEHKLPSINGSNDLKEALQKLVSIPASKTLAVEVLWTPQKENDILSEREYLEDYPLLKPLPVTSSE